MALSLSEVESSLAQMFPALGVAAIKDVLVQCGHNAEVALEQLLDMANAKPLPVAHPSPPPGPARIAHLFPSEQHASQPPNSSTNHNRPPDPLTVLGMGASGGWQEVVSPTAELGQVFPWLATPDTEQGSDGALDAVESAHLPGLPTGRRAACPASRAWWPSWPQSPANTKSPAKSCHVAIPSSSGTPLRAGPSCQHASGSWSAADNLLDASKYRTPPGSAPPSLQGVGVLGSATSDEWEDAGSAATPNGTLFGTPVHSAHGTLRPGTAAVADVASPCQSDDELLAQMLPFLAHCLTSPSPSGATSPTMHASAATEAAAPATLAGGSLQRQQELEQQGFDPAQLVEAVDFHCAMFSNLKREVVGDVLQRYCDAPHTALDQLIMLSSCVEDAALTTAAAVSGEPLPDHHAWDSGSGSDEEGSGGSVGHSWEAAMTPAELAALEGGFVPASLAAALGGQQAQQQQQARPLFPEGDDSLPAEEKLALLKAEFKSVSSEEVAAALAACDSSLFAAAELLRVFAAEDAAAGRNGGALNGRAAAAAASVPAAAALPVPAAAASSGSFLPPHARPEVAHPTRLFPDAPSESLEVALQSCSYDLTTASRTLRQAGYAKVEAPQAAVMATLPRPMPLPSVLSLVPLPQLDGVSAGSSSAPSAPAALLSLSEATHMRNQSIFQQERATQLRMQEAYRRCFELASQQHSRGNHEAANELRMQGHTYKQKFEEEKRRASRRISTRVNAGAQPPVIQVDLHCLYVDDALAMVESGIRNLPESIPGGVVVKYITGKGLHSGGGAAKIKPAVIDLLTGRGVPFVEGPGWVEATLKLKE